MCPACATWYARPVKRVVKWTTFEGAVADEVRYWLGLTIEERISGVEVIRRASWRLYGGAPTRMARVSARVEAPWRPVPARRRARAGRPRSAAIHAGSRRAGRATRQALGSALPRAATISSSPSCRRVRVLLEGSPDGVPGAFHVVLGSFETTCWGMMWVKCVRSVSDVGEPCWRRSAKARLTYARSISHVPDHVARRRHRSCV